MISHKLNFITHETINYLHNLYTFLLLQPFATRTPRTPDVLLQEAGGTLPPTEDEAVCYTLK